MDLTGYFEYILPVKMLEVLALRASLIWLQDACVSNVCFESDAKGVVDSIQAASDDWFECGQVIDDCRQLLNQGLIGLYHGLRDKLI